MIWGVSRTFSGGFCIHSAARVSASKGFRRGRGPGRGPPRRPAAPSAVLRAAGGRSGPAEKTCGEIWENDENIYGKPWKHHALTKHKWHESENLGGKP